MQTVLKLRYCTVSHDEHTVVQTVRAAAAEELPRVGHPAHVEHHGIRVDALISLYNCTVCTMCGSTVYQKNTYGDGSVFDEPPGQLGLVLGQLDPILDCSSNLDIPWISIKYARWIQLILYRRYMYSSPIFNPTFVLSKWHFSSTPSYS